MPKKPLLEPVTWLSEKTINENCPKGVSFYEKFQFKNIIASIGDFILVSNADAAEPDTEEGCDAARIVSLYENREKNHDPYRAKVQWYTRPGDLPSSGLNNVDLDSFSDKEVIEDHRPFDTDVSIETFFKKCNITITFTHTNPAEIISETKPFEYICRYRITAVSKRKFNLEPVLEQERKAIELLSTPTKAFSPIPQTPNSLVKRMNRVSINDSKSWSVSKKDDTKLLLKRAILADKIEKDSPKKTPRSMPKKVDTPKSMPRKVETPKSLNKSKRIETPKKSEIPISVGTPRGIVEDNMMSMELEEGSDDELPTLIIRRHVPTTPKRKSIVSKSNTPINTPVIKMMDFDDDFLQTTTRSGRKVRNADYLEPELSPVKRTPVSSTRKRDTQVSDDEDFNAEATPRTPRTPRTTRTSVVTPKARTPRASVGNATPRSVKRKIMTSQLTPSLKSRAHSVENVAEFAKDNKSLPGREQQLEEILSFVRNKLLESSSGCMYISGVPGTGKTATVCAALGALQTEAGLPDFQRVDINGMRLAEPRQAYVHIYKQLTGKTVAWEQACSLLEKRFTNPGPRRTPTVLLVDELDALCTRRQDVVYGIVEWCCSRDARLTVLAVANTMDLPERALHNRVASRLGLTRLTFPPYTHTQLQAIVATRLADANVTPDAVQLIARKVASVSGDARRALALCARAVELGAGGGGAGLPEVQKALAEASSGAGVRAIRACAPAERLMLRAVASEVERTGSDETSLSRALLAAAALVAVEGRPYRCAKALRPPTPAQALSICARLSSLKLLLLEPKAEPRLLLNVSTDDVHYATRHITC